MNNSVKMLIAALVLLAVALVYAYINWPHQTHAPRVSSSEISDIVVPDTNTVPYDSGDSPGSMETQQHTTLVIRNIFAPFFTQPETPAVPDRQETGSPVNVNVPVRPQLPSRPMPVFMGKLQHQGQQKVFLSVAGEVYIVGLYDYFGPDNNYQVLDISSKSLVLKYEKDAESFEIEAIEQPVSVLGASGSGDVEPMEKLNQVELSVPTEPGILDKEVPIDKIIDE